MKKIFIITNKDDVTVDFVIKELKKRGAPYYRLNTEDIPNIININFNLSLSEYKLFDNMKQKTVNILDFDSVYFRRPVVNDFKYIEGISDQERNYLRNECFFALEGIYKTLNNKYWLNNVYNIREAENKIFQLQLAQEIGLNIPGSIISNNIDSINKFMNIYEADFITKPIKSGDMKDKKNSKAVYTTKLEKYILSEAERVKSFPIYLQENIRKIYDLRVIVIGNKVYTAQIHSQGNINTKIDWRKGPEIPEHSEHKLPKEIERKCLELTERLGLNYSAIDLVLDTFGEYIFLEINPNGQWAWIEKRLGFPIASKIAELLAGGNDGVD